ncbi:MAG: protein-export membrane protein SecF [Bdellovibrionales bacterium RIFOXYD12_FULL_39_22]|nr:MAG: protein-export membrane protein SecF [Bdellovibrionales bacterium RIFOXYB1_FULL_39_21]OFZ44283.1 MAG: protein-export membrane protein SecF [Bdellovibrionales bacterium RIFOXYC12_FULL_39_17]OFZ46831.1 MAG: protein-export membrane protein SecF [Bdellovibrionales bacterium RIFOXYC1_FULL_39_130]OFZ76093.1 MAG: protein-export membrane protein SecF [Bdellovibrionales bacterium RIFOXYD1_FULL_39_84]OFZ76489.1 MAG: protein-export membrane protein SecF [Bdellovibrionales bacterium RIFOXYC2_FULL_3
MFEILKPGMKIDFTSKMIYTSSISAILVILSLIGIFTSMNYGVDFRGGAEIQTKFKTKVSIDGLRKTMDVAQFKGVSVQTIGEAKDNEFLVKVQADNSNLNEISQKISEALISAYAAQGVEIRKVDIVGPKAGAELRNSGFLAIFWALMAILIYVGIRFDFKYAPGAVIALFHDVVIVLGIFSLTGTEFTLQIVAAVLAIVGYSVNDTVIIYDRIREHEAQYPGLDIKTHINNAASETLSRTIITSGATLLSCLGMYFLGGIAIRDFFFAMSLGIIVGTYSSIYVAAAVTIAFEKFFLGKKKAA